MSDLNKKDDWVSTIDNMNLKVSGSKNSDLVEAMWSLKYYNNIENLSTDEVHYWNNTLWENSLNMLGDLKDKEILELWCGTWENSMVMSKLWGKVTWIDIEQDRIDIAIKNMSIKKIEYDKLDVNFLQWDANHLPFDDNKFDLIESSMVLEYVGDVQNVLKEVKRVMKDDWKFVFCISHENQIKWEKKFDNFEMYSKWEIEKFANNVWLKLVDYRELNQVDTRDLDKEELKKYPYRIKIDRNIEYNTDEHTTAVYVLTK